MTPFSLHSALMEFFVWAYFEGARCVITSYQPACAQRHSAAWPGKLWEPKDFHTETTLQASSPHLSLLQSVKDQRERVSWSATGWQSELRLLFICMFCRYADYFDTWWIRRFPWLLLFPAKGKDTSGLQWDITETLPFEEEIKTVHIKCLPKFLAAVTERRQLINISLMAEYLLCAHFTHHFWVHSEVCFRLLSCSMIPPQPFLTPNKPWVFGFKELNVWSDHRNTFQLKVQWSVVNSKQSCLKRTSFRPSFQTVCWNGGDIFWWVWKRS